MLELLSTYTEINKCRSLECRGKGERLFWVSDVRPAIKVRDNEENDFFKHLLIRDGGASPPGDFVMVCSVCGLGVISYEDKRFNREASRDAEEFWEKVWNDYLDAMAKWDKDWEEVSLPNGSGGYYTLIRPRR